MLEELYLDARVLAGHDLLEEAVDPAILPRRCPWSLDQILDTDWLPESVHGLRDDVPAPDNEKVS